ncbi:hypothetical protein [uncultured Marivirga sp.]|uniref:hypothetical protein n=1 Tax=uncultured Marivirga sp. TaxID=1123707 RepID=UPI0030EB4332
MRTTFIILSLFIALQANSQNYIRTIDNLDTWAGQLKYDYELLSRFDKYCRSNNLLNGSLAMIDARGANSWDYTRAVDLNNDGLQDVVFDGPSGGEPNIVYFFIQTNSGFEQVFEVMQGISKVTWKDELLSQVITSDWGCCASIHLTHTIYNVNYDNQNRPVFTKAFQSIEVRDELTKPKEYLSDPIRFTVNNQGYKLRLEPAINDTTEYHWLDITGNTFANLKAGTVGTALAEQTDETGRIWWYVAINFDTNVQNCILNTTDEFPTKVISWISSRYVTKNEE